MLKRRAFPLGALAALSLAVLSTRPPPAPAQGRSPQAVPVYRVYDPRSGEHRYTDDPGERTGWLSSGRYQDEGAPFALLPYEGPDLAPLYRLALPNGSTALGIMTQPGYTDPRGPVDKTLGLLSIKQQPGWVSLYEWHNPRRGLWFYTTDPRGEGAQANGYRYSRIVGYVLPAS
jgi:hypothetical protein